MYRLVGTRCEACQVMYFPPRHYCVKCYSGDSIKSAELSPCGVLYSWSIVHVGPRGAPVPYAVGYVDFPENVRVLGRLVNWEEGPLVSGIKAIVEPCTWPDGPKASLSNGFQFRLDWKGLAV